MKRAARTLVVLSAVLLAAHFLRGGRVPLAIVAVLAPALLVIPRLAAARLLQALLGLGVLEWLRTLYHLVGERHALGLPSTRLAVILGCVALVTAVAALLAPRGSRASTAS